MIKMVSDEVYKKRLKKGIIDDMYKIERRLDGLSVDQLVQVSESIEDIERSKHDNNERVIATAWSADIHNSTAIQAWGAKPVCSEVQQQAGIQSRGRW